MHHCGDRIFPRTVGAGGARPSAADRRVYVLIRNDLGPSYGAVQGGHALAEHLLRGKREGWDNDTLVYLAVDDMRGLEQQMSRLHERSIPFTVFREPDIGYEITALACACDKREFSGFRLF